MQIDQYTAKRAVRALTKSTAWTRQELQRLHATDGGIDSRDKLHQKFTDKDAQAKEAIAATERAANAFDRATLTVRTREADNAATGLPALASIYVKLGGTSDALAARLDHAAERARASAGVAEANYDRAEHDVKATLAFGRYLQARSDKGDRHPTTKRHKASFEAHRHLARQK